MAETIVTPKKYMKYLGIWIDDKTIFDEHIERTCKKADRQVTALTKILPNIRGPGSNKKVLYGVVPSVLLYAAPVWARNGFGRRVHLDNLEGVTEADKLRERETTVNEWQDRWERNHSTAQWTKRLIPHIKSWLKCDFKTLNYYVTQALTGHGSFRMYTLRIEKSRNDLCKYCGERDDPKHTDFECNRWHAQRTGLETYFGAQITPENLLETMVRNRRSWTEGVT
ncbi:uncharacterized protein [Leptinotarsa decemlineata]|uniref:uncharacterized protein n=1 Tax=Leptinotarsa decemlineata TaxID=7539 RepID=UPI003D30570C